MKQVGTEPEIQRDLPKLLLVKAIKNLKKGSADRLGEQAWPRRGLD